MPCYTERTISVALEVADVALLFDALTAAGMRPVLLADDSLAIQSARGAAILRAGQLEAPVGYAGVKDARALAALAGEIKVAYARQAVQVASKRYGFALAQDKQDANHLTLARRTF